MEWETEVFEKFEKPYRRTGGGLALAEQYLDEPDISQDSLLQLVRLSVTAMDTYLADSITTQLKKPAHLFLHRHRATTTMPMRWPIRNNIPLSGP